MTYGIRTKPTWEPPTAASEAPVISARNLSLFVREGRSRIRIVSDVSFEIRAGEFFALSHSDPVSTRRRDGAAGEHDPSNNGTPSTPVSLVANGIDNADLPTLPLNIRTDLLVHGETGPETVFELEEWVVLDGGRSGRGAILRKAVVSVRPRDLFDQVDLACHVVAAVSGNPHAQPTAALCLPTLALNRESEGRQQCPQFGIIEPNAEHLLDPGWPKS